MPIRFHRGGLPWFASEIPARDGVRRSRLLPIEQF